LCIDAPGESERSVCFATGKLGEEKLRRSPIALPRPTNSRFCLLLVRFPFGYKIGDLFQISLHPGVKTLSDRLVLNPSLSASDKQMHSTVAPFAQYFNLWSVLVNLHELTTADLIDPPITATARNRMLVRS
jgi:hypothetical protein